MSKKTGMAIKLLSFVVIIALGAISMMALGASDKKSKKREAKPEVRKVQTVEISFQDIQVEIEGNGVIEAQKTLDMISEVRGLVTYAKNDLKSGTFVTKGESICKIDQRQAENSLLSLRSDFIKVITSFLAYAKIEGEEIDNKWMSYLNKLDINSDLPPLPEIASAREKILISNHNIQTQYYAVKNAEINLSKYIIKAPFDGYISSAGMILGSYVNAGQRVVTLRDVKNIEISIPLLLEDAHWINFSENPKVKVSWGENEDEWVYGYIYRKDNRLERNSQSMNVFVSLQNSSLNPHLFPGNYVKVLIQGKIIPNVAKIPRYTLDNDNNIYYVVDGNKLGRHKAEVVSFQQDHVLINQTLPKKTRIVTSLLQKPLVGMEIEDVDNPPQNSTEFDSLTAVEKNNGE